MLREDFDALDPVKRASFIRSGGKVEDPPAASGTMPYIADGKRRMQWIETRRAADANARLNAEIDAELAAQRAALGR